jgi:plasmid replication initiation protein
MGFYLKMDKLLVYKDNYLIEASYKLTLSEQRLMLYCIGKLNPQNPEQKQVIRVDDFIKHFPDVKPNNAYQQIKSSIDAIAERWIRVKDPSFIEEFRWIQYKKYYSDEGSAVIEFSNAVMPYLCQLEQQFTQYQLRNISAFKRTYSIRLYELLTQYRTLKSRVILINDLRDMLSLDGKFAPFKELRRKVIDPAIAEINEKSDLKIEYIALKTGRAFGAIEFFITVDEQIDMFERTENNKQKIKELKSKLKQQKQV